MMWALGTSQTTTWHPSIAQGLLGLATRSGESLGGLESTAHELLDATDVGHPDRGRFIRPGPGRPAGSLVAQDAGAESMGRAALCRISAMATDATTRDAQIRGIESTLEQALQAPDGEAAGACLTALRQSNVILGALRASTTAGRGLHELWRERGTGMEPPRDASDDRLPLVDLVPRHPGTAAPTSAAARRYADPSAFLKDTELQQRLATDVDGAAARLRPLQERVAARLATLPPEALASVEHGEPRPEEVRYTEAASTTARSLSALGAAYTQLDAAVFTEAQRRQDVDRLWDASMA